MLVCITGIAIVHAGTAAIELAIAFMAGATELLITKKWGLSPIFFWFLGYLHAFL